MLQTLWRPCVSLSIKIKLIGGACQRIEHSGVVLISRCARPEVVKHEFLSLGVKENHQRGS